MARGAERGPGTRHGRRRGAGPCVPRGLPGPWPGRSMSARRGPASVPSAPKSPAPAEAPEWSPRALWWPRRGTGRTASEAPPRRGARARRRAQGGPGPGGRLSRPRPRQGRWLWGRGPRAAPPRRSRSCAPAALRGPGGPLGSLRGHGCPRPGRHRATRVHRAPGGPSEKPSGSGPHEATAAPGLGRPRASQGGEAAPTCAQGRPWRRPARRRQTSSVCSAGGHGPDPSSAPRVGPASMARPARAQGDTSAASSDGPPAPRGPGGCGCPAPARRGKRVAAPSPAATAGGGEALGLRVRKSRPLGAPCSQGGSSRKRNPTDGCSSTARTASHVGAHCATPHPP